MLRRLATALLVTLGMLCAVTAMSTVAAADPQCPDGEVEGTRLKPHGAAR